MADRERVSLVTVDIDIDVHTLANKVVDPNLSLRELEDLVVSLQKTFLTGIDLPNQEIFQQWLAAERQEIVRLEGKVLDRLSSHTELDYSKRLVWARSWEQLEPFNACAATQLLSLLDLVGNTSEATNLTSEFTTRFRNAGIEWASGLRVEFDAKVKIPEEKPVELELLADKKFSFVVHLMALKSPMRPLVKAHLLLKQPTDSTTENMIGMRQSGAHCLGIWRLIIILFVTMSAVMGRRTGMLTTK